MAFVDAVAVEVLMEDFEGEAADGRDADNDDVGAEAGITDTFGGKYGLDEGVRVAEEEAVAIAGVETDLTGEGRDWIGVAVLGTDEDIRDDAAVDAAVDADVDPEAVDAVAEELGRAWLRSAERPSSLGDTSAYLGSATSRDGSIDLER